MSESSGGSAPVRILIKFALNVGLAAFLAVYLDEYFRMTGGMSAYVVMGSLLTLMNIIVRPVLSIILLPLKLFVTILAIIILHAVFVQIAVMIVQRMDPEIITLEIFGGLWGWIIVAVILGLGNWTMKAMLK